MPRLRATLFTILCLLTTITSTALAVPVTVESVIDSTPLVQGSSARLAVKITIDPRFHIQSATPHDKFLIPTSIKIHPANGITPGLPRFPIAKEIKAIDPIGISSISAYQGTIYILVPLTITPDAPLGPTTISLSVTAQACDKSTCLPPATYHLSIPITIAPPGTTSPNNPNDFTAADAQSFIPPSTDPTPSPTTTPTPPAPTPNSTLPGLHVPLLSAADQISLINQRPYKPFNTAEHNYPLALIILFALLGGAILNVMPCVLPVIPLKVLSLIQQAHGNRKLSVLHALSFSAGIISLFVLLALLLKIFGLFYGQQFQSPAFVIAMIMFVVALALSMIGVWTINPPNAVYDVHTAATGHAASFTNGLMATLLATPCSAPYLGPVLAWALLQPTWVTALALALVGVGMSIPYLLLAAFPGALAKLPRAGRWSELLKQALGIVMIGVAVYLITLVSNVTLWPWILLGTVVLGLTCWGWGQIPAPTSTPQKLWITRTIVLAVGLSLGLGVYVLAARAAIPQAAPENPDTLLLPDTYTGEWLPFNTALLDAALKQGRPVVVDWTADWCINCRALDAFVLSTQPVKNSFRQANAVLLKADLSRDNPPATRLNEKLGGQAIPVLAVFSPRQPTDPVVLRDGYTTTRVITEVQNAH